MNQFVVSSPDGSRGCECGNSRTNDIHGDL